MPHNYEAMIEDALQYAEPADREALRPRLEALIPALQDYYYALLMAATPQSNVSLH
jgi:hypothetical protein